MKSNLLLIAVLFTSTFAFSQSATFNYLGAPQYFVVPASVTNISVDVRGAQGGTASNMTQAPNTSPGGNGGRVTASLGVTPGDTIWIYVGGIGQSTNGTLTCVTAVGGWNGGGFGYAGYNSYNYNSGAGGGATDLRMLGQTLNDRILVAGGGGGAGCSGCTGGGKYGGGGGNTTGQDGEDSGPSCFPLCNNGKGGSPTVGGGLGNWACQCTTSNATAGTLGIGGDGDGSGCPVTCGSGGGGGGGYYGGGGGSAGPGGGGSSYTSVSFSSVNHTQGFQAGNGQVIIDYTPLSQKDLNQVPFSIQVSPNPITNIASLSILGNFNGEGTLIVTDMRGKEIVEWKVSGIGKHDFDMTGIQPGQYIVRLVSGEYQATHSFIKQF